MLASKEKSIRLEKDRQGQQEYQVTEQTKETNNDTTATTASSNWPGTYRSSRLYAVPPVT
jgi:hypothetical protein